DLYCDDAAALETSACDDGADNDVDGWTDLADPGCSDVTDDDEGGIGVPNLGECTDGIDNDTDSFIDGFDSNCDDASDTSETPRCDDSIDNDTDGWVDLADPGCSGITDDDELNVSTTECNDGIDNDGDGDIDSLDSECVTALDAESNCTDGVDDDADGWADSLDPDCAAPLFFETNLTSGTQCNDGVSNGDNDILVDSADPDCISGLDNNEDLAACNNITDDDADGWVDLADPGCLGSVQTETEGGFSPLLACNDGVDNDADGDTDGDDLQCATATSATESTDLCADGFDNDYDGWTDAADPDCVNGNAEIGVDPSRLAVGGDSAGGNLAAVVAQMARDKDGPAIGLQVLNYPVTNCDFTTPSYTDNAEGFGLGRQAMEYFWEQYLASPTQGVEPYASPAQAADLSGLPPALVLTAELDPLRDEGEAYAHTLQAAAVAVSCTRYDGLIHGFLGQTHAVPEADQAHTQIAEALKAALG
ncbi:MAG: alpha/beta hydrolase fold domain-containing protein, partial [Candidatus Poribacteria bacterium]